MGQIRNLNICTNSIQVFRPSVISLTVHRFLRTSTSITQALYCKYLYSAH